MNVLEDRAARRPPCSYCGKPILRKGWNYGKRAAEHYFCDRNCKDKWQSEHRVGENHPRFMGGFPDYYGNTWRTQRALARKRDKVCQRCGKTQKENGKALDVHHITPYREFGFSKQAEAHRLENLICYCASCHQLVEWELIHS